MYSVLEVVRTNPGYGTLDVLQHFEKELEVGKHVQSLKNEIGKTMKVRRELRVLRAKRMEVEEVLKYAQMEIEAEVYIEYPPRKGTDAQREKLRLELQNESSNYQEAKRAFRDAAELVLDKEDEFASIETECKNARRMLELFQSYSAFIKELKLMN